MLEIPAQMEWWVMKTSKICIKFYTAIITVVFSSIYQFYCYFLVFCSDHTQSITSFWFSVLITLINCFYYFSYTKIKCWIWMENASILKNVIRFCFTKFIVCDFINWLILVYNKLKFYQFLSVIFIY